MKKLRYLTALLCIVLAAMMLSGCGKTSSQVEAEKQAEKEARRKAKLDEKFKTRTADPLKASDIDMVPEDDD